MERRLTTILAADVVGYSRLMEADEVGTLAALNDLRLKLIDPAIGRHGGRIVKLMGDGLLIEFASPVAAVVCATGLQDEIAKAERGRPEESRIAFRIGINMDRVIVEGEDLFGDGVNIAARLEGMAEPGGVLVSDGLHSAVRDGIDTTFFDNGMRKFKNISRPLRVWSWPRRLPSLRAHTKPRVHVEAFLDAPGGEMMVGGEIAAELEAHLGRLTGIELSASPNEAHYLVQGGARLARGRARLHARLVAVENERQIWSDRYVEDSDDAMELLDRCVPRMAMGIRRHVAADDAARLADRKLDELSLEELLAHAGASFFRPTAEGWRGGGEISEQALELAPDNFMALAMAAAGLGLADYLYGLSRPAEDVTNLAIERIEKALRLNNRSDMAYAVRAGLLLFAQMRHREASIAAQRSLELNAGYNMGYWMLAAAQVFSGSPDAGVENGLRAVEIDIRDPYVHLYDRIVAYGHLGAGRADEAAEWFGRADQLAPGLPPNLIGLAVASWRSGDADHARSTLQRLAGDRGTRLANLHPLPYRDQGEWRRFVEDLRDAGLPE